MPENPPPKNARIVNLGCLSPFICKARSQCIVLFMSKFEENRDFVLKFFVFLMRVLAGIGFGVWVRSCRVGFGVRGNGNGRGRGFVEMGLGMGRGVWEGCTIGQS